MKSSNYFKILVYFFLFFQTNIYAQIKFGVGPNWGNNVTSNLGRMGKTKSSISGLEVFNERKFTSNNYFISFYAENQKAGALKVQFGRHTNGVLIDFRTWTDLLGSGSQINNIESEYVMLQMGLSYIYNLDIGKSRIPLELGFLLNRTISQGQGIAYINQYNKDFKIATGYIYKFTSSFHLGIGFVYSRALNNYLDTSTMNGEYLPMQYGTDFSIRYYFE